MKFFKVLRLRYDTINETACQEMKNVLPARNASGVHIVACNCYPADIAVAKELYHESV